MIITEDYVDFETAKLLNEKGFDEDCSSAFYKDGTIVTRYDSEYSYNYYDRPTLQMVVKYLEEVYHILVVADYEYECTSTSWYFKIYRLDKNGKPERVPVEGVSYDINGVEHKNIVCYRDFKRSYKDYPTRKEAIEDGIKYCFENFI